MFLKKAALAAKSDLTSRYAPRQFFFQDVADLLPSVMAGRRLAKHEATNGLRPSNQNSSLIKTAVLNSDF
jgi:hypothetical protein